MEVQEGIPVKVEQARSKEDLMTKLAEKKRELLMRQYGDSNANNEDEGNFYKGE